ncbi:MAG: hypothetical protein WC551_06825 [Patescibacteria group bacterium]
MFKVASLDGLNGLLRGNLLYANGKNFRVDHLHATAAESRFEYENLFGIYLTEPAHAWMAVWMAAANREVLKKRQLEYYRPAADSKDRIGRLGVHLPDTDHLPGNVLVERAYVYFFDLAAMDELYFTEVNWCEGKQRMTILQGYGFDPKSLELRGRNVTAWVPDHERPMAIKLDAWQVAVVNVPRLVPTVEAELQPSLMSELRERIFLLDHEPGENYLR